MQSIFSGCGALCAAFFFVAASAQTPTSGEQSESQQLRQQERELQRRQQLEPQPDVRLQPTVAEPVLRFPSDETPCSLIERVLLAGEMSNQFADLLTAADIAGDGSRDAIKGRCIGTAGISVVIRRLQNELVRRGFVTTRVLVAPQDLTHGVIGVTLIPGRIRNIRFTETTSMRATTWNAIPMRAGDLLNLREIEQALENLKRVPTVDAEIRIVPADSLDATPGYSDIVIEWRQKFPFRLNLSADNSGLESTGRYQGAFTLSYDHALTLNDLFYVSVNNSLFTNAPSPSGTNGKTLHYSLPFGHWLVAATTSSNQYRQPIASVIGTTIYSGESSNHELKLSRVLARDANSKTSAYLSVWSKQSHNYIGDVEMVVQRRQLGGWEAGWARRQILGAATLDLNAGYRRGTGAFGSQRRVNEDMEGSSRPQIIQLGALYNLPFVFASQRMRYTLAVRAQHAGRSLLPQDRFSLGSRFSVRGFDEQRILSADEGWLVRNDLGVSLGGSGQEAYLGLDYGELHGRHSDQLLGKHLAGMALGIRGGAYGLTYDLFAGRALSAPVGFSAQGLNVGFSVSWSY
ncbi:MAG: ShlB/FhaC/HecB family hemolysin secretion/activation protein [Burkholderiaceae bacterium]